jgi:hypothetical protein
MIIRKIVNNICKGVFTMKLRRILTVSVFIFLVLFIVIQPVSGLTDRRIRDVLLDKNDMSNFKLAQEVTLAYTWPVVFRLPGYMNSPENPPLTGTPINPVNPDIAVLNPIGMSLTRKDGLRQRWESKDSAGNWVAIDYGYYDTPEIARNSLKYLVYERTVPNFNSYYYPTSHPMNIPMMPPGTLPAHPSTSISIGDTTVITSGNPIPLPYPPHYNFPGNYYSPSCRRLNYGDLSYFVSVPTGGGVIYFTKGRYIFMVDAPQQSLEDQIVNVILAKMAKMKL